MIYIDLGKIKVLLSREFYQASCGIEEIFRERGNALEFHREILKLCKIKKLPDLKDLKSYLGSLALKDWNASYHAKQAQGVWDDFRLAHPRGFEIGGANLEWWEVYYASAAETEAAVQNLRAEVDILAQVTNRIVLNKCFTEGKVSLHHVLEKLKKGGLAPDLIRKLETLKSSKEFKYVGAFCNTIKHRKLIEREWRAEGGEATRNEEGVRFLAFSYEGNNFPTTWASDINGHYRETLGRYVEAIGNAIIGYLRSIP